MPWVPSSIATFPKAEVVFCEKVPLDEFEYGGLVWVPCAAQVTIPNIGADRRSATLFKALLKSSGNHRQIDRRYYFFCFLEPIFGIGERMVVESVLMRIGVEVWEPDEDGYANEPLLDLHLPGPVSEPFDRPPLLVACWDLIRQ
jgi:hypothetical protein